MRGFTTSAQMVAYVRPMFAHPERSVLARVRANAGDGESKVALIYISFFFRLRHNWVERLESGQDGNF